MEGLIPFVYRAIVQYKNDGNVSLGSLMLNESPSASYMRLPGDSGRYRSVEACFFSSSSAATGYLSAVTALQSPVRRSASARRA
ncbi:uncharacterized protein [Typha latifolia]|uniref:uncharacterized protein n=1 Tax=Typha latifolia TaxID=4733 RepID=UPI003C308B9E